MLFRLPLLLAIAMLGLCACNDDDDDDQDSPTPTPTPAVTPTPTPSADTDTDGDGISDVNDDDADGNGIDDADEDDGTDSIGNSGAPMTADDELVGVSSIDSTDVTQSLITVVRSNGEIWEFDIPGIPTTAIGATLTYRNVALVFGAVSGEIIFADGTVSQINASRRIQ
jgi:hypothetical protein